MTQTCTPSLLTRIIACLAVAALSLAGAAAPLSAQNPDTAPDANTDDLSDAMRIVSLGGSVTEIVYALGAGDEVVGVDASSLYPEAARELPDVGYFRRVPAEGVLSLEPTVVLASAETGPPETLDQLRSAGVDVHVIPEESSVDGAREKIRAIASVLDRREAADRLIREMEEDLEEARRLRSSTDQEPRVLFVYARGAGTMQVAGRGTSAEAMIELAGARNAITGFDGFKPMSAESVAAAEPDVILMLDRGLESIGGVDGLLQQPGIALTPAGENRRIVAMDDLLMLSFGPRLGEAVKTLTQKLYPNVSSASIR
ncbi:MAG: ABC transporter substrate-binding protein [Bacteroidetes bacterium]|jgi:iron complex transport system substrate-binding protein|nr:ABC transporter substrate-binding protein [Bacteroidota bacterium]